MRKPDWKKLFVAMGLDQYSVLMRQPIGSAGSQASMLLFSRIRRLALRERYAPAQPGRLARVTAILR